MEISLVKRKHHNSVFDLEIQNEPGVYIIIHDPTMKIYIGSTGTLRRRWYQHLSALRCNKHYVPELQLLYNRDHQIRFIVAELSPTREIALEREQQILNSYIEHGILLNQTYVVDRPTLGRPMSDETKKKLSIAKTGTKTSTKTIELLKRKAEERRKTNSDILVQKRVLCRIKGITYLSIQQAAKALKISNDTASRKNELRPWSGARLDPKLKMIR